jgi:hypothetical protein
MRKSFLIILGFLAIGLAAFLLFRRDTPVPPQKPPPDSPSNQSSSPGRSSSPGKKTGPPKGPNFYAFPEKMDPPRYPVAPPENDHRLTPLKNGSVQINPAIDHARALHDPNMTTADDIEQLDAMIGLYFWAYKQNPVGDNEDIVDQLTGNNEKRIVILPPDHPAINANGELLDRYGNPYFFHALSEDKMDIWSYGPDGIVGTIDDVVLFGPEADPDPDPDPEAEAEAE